MSAFDLDAVIGELADKPLRYKGQEFKLPAEFPAECLVPFLDDDLGLIELAADVLADSSEDDESDWTDLVEKVLRARPKLPKEVLAALADSLRILMGDDNYASFQALKPSINAYVLIAKAVVTEYGTGLTDFFGSDESSDGQGDGDDSKETSPSTTTGSTPDPSGGETTPTTSASGG